MGKLKVRYGAWVVIGDGRKALLLHNEGDEELLNLRRLDVREQEDPPTREQGSDAPGRAVASGSLNARSSAVGQTDWHQLEEDRFAATLTARLNRAAHDNAFHDLVIVAPPKALAEIRRDLSGEAQKKVRAEIAKDLTNHPIPEIEKLLPTYDAD